MSISFDARGGEDQSVDPIFFRAVEVENLQWPTRRGVLARAIKSSGRRPTREGGLPCSRLRTDVGQLEQTEDLNAVALEIPHHSDLKNMRS